MYVDLDVSENNGTPKSSILIGFSMKKTIHFGVPLFLETLIYVQISFFFSAIRRPNFLQKFPGSFLSSTGGVRGLCAGVGCSSATCLRHLGWSQGWGDMGMTG